MTIAVMQCEQCGGETTVLEKRDGDRRRRQCSVCGFRFTTIEVAADTLTRYRAVAAQLHRLRELLADPSPADFAQTAPLDILL